MLVSIFKKKLNEIESSCPEILLFYCTFNKRYCHQVEKIIKLNISNNKPFDVEFRYIIHFKTVEVHFNATFGEYQILIYWYFSKIL